MTRDNEDNPWKRFLQWQIAYLKIIAVLSIALLVGGSFATLFHRGGVFRSDDFVSLISLTAGGFLGFYGIALFLSGSYFTFIWLKDAVNLGSF